MIGKTRPPMRVAKPPIPRFQYKLVTVAGSQAASRMEKALRERLSEIGLTYFAIGHENGSYDVMGDSGLNALADNHLLNAKAVAAKISKAG